VCVLTQADNKKTEANVITDLIFMALV